MLTQIFKERYGKTLIGACLILIAIYLGAGWQSQKDWHTQYNYLYSDEFIYDYTNHPSYYVKSYDGEKEIRYESIDAYRQDVLTIGKNHDGNDTYFYNDFSYAQPQLILLTLFILGFLAFFVDYRTNFTRFLLTLPVQKKTLFRKKIGFVSLAISVALLIGIVGNCLIRSLMIDQSYFMIPIANLLLSGLSTFFTNILVFMVGLFLGISLGNLVTGPLSVLFVLFLSTIGSNFYSSFRLLYSLAFLNGKEDVYAPFSLWIAWPEGRYYDWWVYLLYAGLFLLLFVVMEKVFLALSLDNEGEYVTVPFLRAPAYWIMALGTWFYLFMANYYPHDFFYIKLYDDFSETYQGIIFRSLLLLFVCLIISLLMVYPKALMGWWHKRRNKLT
ncbi:ABC transporter permease [Enterococcus sp.]|uniref:ABC transporter permease n=1 Tax=Enterococcus sp. TaxID=35783 RepID=UPI00289C663C|nr:ABC transporter permease [Enterococcus sp.]